MSAHLVKRMKDMSGALPRPRIGEWDVPSLLIEAAEEIERLREYALHLESDARHQNLIQTTREQIGVNWMAIHGVSP